jgi:hypothetical protein
VVGFCCSNIKDCAHDLVRLEVRTGYTGAFSLTPETQQKIFRVADTLFAELGNAFGYENYGYGKGIRCGQTFIREYGNKTLSALLFDLTERLLPSGSADGSLKPENLELYIAAMDTKEKSEALLLAMPEPDTRTLDLILDAVITLLPNLRQILVPFAKKLPHPPGGRPKKLSDPVKRRAIREEIGKLLASGVSLIDAQKRLASREAVGLSTIQRIWRERKNR